MTIRAILVLGALIGACKTTETSPIDEQPGIDKRHSAPSKVLFEDPACQDRDADCPPNEYCNRFVCTQVSKEAKLATPCASNSDCVINEYYGPMPRLSQWGGMRSRWRDGGVVLYERRLLHPAPGKRTRGHQLPRPAQRHSVSEDPEKEQRAVGPLPLLLSPPLRALDRFVSSGREHEDAFPRKLWQSIPKWLL